MNQYSIKQNAIDFSSTDMRKIAYLSRCRRRFVELRGRESAAGEGVGGVKLGAGEHFRNPRKRNRKAREV